MPANEDLLPDGKGLSLYPGNPYTFTFTWPTSIAGRTFTATLDDTALSPSVSGTDLTIALTAPATEGRAIFTVTETTAVDVVVFRFPIQVSTATGSRTGNTDFTVTDGSVSVTVDVIAADVTAQITAAIDDLLEPGSGLGTYARNAGGVDYRDRSSLFRYGIVTVASTASATSLLASSLTIPANTLTVFNPSSPADASGMTITSGGLVTNTTGSSRTMTYIVTITQGANVCTWTMALTVPNGTSSAPWSMTIDAIPTLVSGLLASPVGRGTLAAQGLTGVVANGSPGVSNFDVTEAWVLTFTATPSTSSSSLSTVCLPGIDVRLRRTIHT